jgi:hypothetical protein
MDGLPKYLFRALRPQEFADGFKLIPKVNKPFVASPMLPNVLPFKLGLRVEHAVRAHQLDSDKYPTSAVSTTPLWSRACYYAVTHRVIVRINTDNLQPLGVQVRKVADVIHQNLINKPEDEEFQLWMPDASNPPESIVDRVFDFRGHTDLPNCPPE